MAFGVGVVVRRIKPYLGRPAGRSSSLIDRDPSTGRRYGTHRASLSSACTSEIRWRGGHRSACFTMNTYQRLLDVIYRATTGKDRPTVAALVAGSNEGDAGASAPLALLPVNAKVCGVEDGEYFVEDACRVVRGQVVDGLFVIPPLTTPRWLSTEFRARRGSLGVAEASVDALLSRVPPAVRSVVVLTPLEFLARSRSGPWRRRLFPEQGVVVVEHDGDMVPDVAEGSHHRYCTVVFTRQPGSVKFFKVTAEGLASGTDSLVGDLEQLLSRPAGRTRFGFVYDGILSEHYPTSHDFYSEKTASLRRQIDALGERVALGDVADVMLGVRKVGSAKKADQPLKGYLAITPSRIKGDGRIDLDELVPSRVAGYLPGYLQAGDICIRQAYRHEVGFVLGVYEGDGRDISWGPGVIVVRPHAHLSPAQRQVIVSFLRSPLAHLLGDAKQLPGSSRGSLRVSPHTLRDFPVPVADKDIVAAIDGLGAARRAFEDWISDIDEAADAIIREATTYHSRERILRSGQLARQRHRAGGQVEDLDYRVRTLFPHPLAYLWRAVEVAGPDPYVRLRAVTMAAEGHTCFLAQLGILLSATINKPIGQLQGIAQRLAKWSGTNFGDWLAVVKEVAESNGFRHLPNGTPLVELTAINADGKWLRAIRELKQLRDDDAHHRLTPSTVTTELVEEARMALEIVYRATEFLTDYRLFLVTDTRLDSLRGITRFAYRDLSGDNPLAPLHSDEAERTNLESGSLYLRDRSGALLLLRPMLHHLKCPECHQMSTFFLDKPDANDSQKVYLKSLERGSILSEGCAEGFRQVRLLP